MNSYLLNEILKDFLPAANVVNNEDKVAKPQAQHLVQLMSNILLYYLWVACVVATVIVVVLATY